jgi:hypothetical protein
MSWPKMELTVLGPRIDEQSRKYYHPGNMQRIQPSVAHGEKAVGTKSDSSSVVFALLESDVLIPFLESPHSPEDTGIEYVAVGSIGILDTREEPEKNAQQRTS